MHSALEVWGRVFGLCLLSPIHLFHAKAFEVEWGEVPILQHDVELTAARSVKHQCNTVPPRGIELQRDIVLTNRFVIQLLQGTIFDLLPCVPPVSLAIVCLLHCSPKTVAITKTTTFHKWQSIDPCPTATTMLSFSLSAFMSSSEPCFVVEGPLGCLLLFFSHAARRHTWVCRCFLCRRRRERQLRWEVLVLRCAGLRIPLVFCGSGKVLGLAFFCCFSELIGRSSSVSGWSLHCKYQTSSGNHYLLLQQSAVLELLSTLSPALEERKHIQQHHGGGHTGTGSSLPTAPSCWRSNGQAQDVDPRYLEHCEVSQSDNLNTTMPHT